MQEEHCNHLLLVQMKVLILAGYETTSSKLTSRTRFGSRTHKTLCSKLDGNSYRVSLYCLLTRYISGAYLSSASNQTSSRSYVKSSCSFPPTTPLGTSSRTVCHISTLLSTRRCDSIRL